MKLEWPPPNRSIGLIDALGITGAVGLLVARFIPIARLPFWGCALRKATGWPCLGCGLTRVADRFAHLNFAGAWDANPLGTIGAGAFALCVVATAMHLGFRVPIPRAIVSEREARWMRAAVLAAVLINYAFVVIKTKFPQFL
jgi:hypothetical protein